MALPCLAKKMGQKVLTKVSLTNYSKSQQIEFQYEILAEGDQLMPF